MSPTLVLTNCPCAPRPAITSLVPNWNIRPSTIDTSSRAVTPCGSMPRIGTLAGLSGLERFGRSMTTYSSAEASAVWPSRLMPGACLMTSASGPSNPLVISLSDPLRSTSARRGDPASSSAAPNPAAIDSTETNTTTTPAMPTIATADELNRCGMVRTLNARTAATCRNQLTTTTSPVVLVLVTFYVLTFYVLRTSNDRTTRF